MSTPMHEDNPRDGVELSEPWTWHEVLSMCACYAAIGSLFVAYLTGERLPVVLSMVAIVVLILVNPKEKPPCK